MKKLFVFLMVMLFSVTCFANPSQISNFSFNNVSFSALDANRNTTVSGSLTNNTSDTYNSVAVVVRFTDDNNNVVQKSGATINNIAGKSVNNFKFSCVMPQNATRYAIDGEVVNNNTGSSPNTTNTNNGTYGFDPTPLLNYFLGYMSPEAQNMLGVFMSSFPNGLPGMPNSGGGVRFR